MGRHAAELAVSSAAEAGLVNGYDHPTRLGAGSLGSRSGARHRLLARAVRRPMVVVMVGTAVTIEAVDAQAGFWAGSSCPATASCSAHSESGTAGLGMFHRRGAPVPDEHQRRADQRGHLRELP